MKIVQSIYDKFLSTFFTMLLVGAVTSGIAQQITPSYLNQLTHEHDLISLPDWGPYTKNYIGISHIADTEQGIRLDLSVFPGYYRRLVQVPNVNFESGYHPWETSPKLDYFSYRHELEWKDEVYTDVSYTEIDSAARLVRIEAVNNTEDAQSIVLHLMGSIHFPPIAAYQADNPIYLGKVSLPEKGEWKEAIHYTKANFSKKTPFTNLPHIGIIDGERRRSGCVDGSCLEIGEEGDQVEYNLTVDEPLTDAVMVFHFQLKEEGKNSFILELGETKTEITTEGNEKDFQTISIPLKTIEKGQHTFSLTANGGTPVFMDGFAFVEASQQESLAFTTANWNYVPKLLDGPTENTLLLKYADVDIYYGLKWNYDDFEVREWYYEKLSDKFRKKANDHVNKVFRDGSDRHFTNVFLRPVNLAPNSKKVIDAFIYSGTKEEVSQRLRSDEINTEEIYNKARTSLIDFEEGTVPKGQQYVLSNRIFAANILGNLVYPVYTQGQYIKHYPPGRIWDILYTWDAGFINLGLAQLDVQNAIEYLNTYVNDADEQAAFIHHGSMVPVQHYAYKELWEKTQSKEYLAYFYPKLKKYYDFYVGKSGSSTMANLNSGLIQTWDYFYNSGGWDDYPPQKYMHKAGIKQKTAPVINTAQSIRIAKIMRQAAEHLGYEKDVKFYTADIEKLSEALQKHSWDEASGYFGYVLHNENREAVEILKYQDSINFNMGMGGAYPLVADACTPEQKETLIEKLKTEGRLWSKVGLSAVDQAAPYFQGDGYWNGSVWMPHQWFFWKAMLDMGEADFAFKIAKTGLDVWKRETDRSYNTYEHFVIETGAGAGWHQFTGLSTPVTCWFYAYYRVGNFTTGYNAWASEKTWNADHSEFSAALSFDNEKGESCSMVAVMNPEHDYQVYWNGKEVETKVLHEGTLSISLKTTRNKEEGTIKIQRKK